MLQDVDVNIVEADKNLPVMADVRALLAAERQSRRISHPFLTYTKSGALTCNVCDLNVKSEQLWPGHLKSANHRKNAQKFQEATAKPLKRKLDDVEEENNQSNRDYEVDNRKKPKPTNDDITPQEVEIQNKTDEARQPEDSAVHAMSTKSNTLEKSSLPQTPAQNVPSKNDAEQIDEDEWAAFERDIKPLAQPDYSAATITAAPMSASEVAAQQENETRHTREHEAEDEKEDESRRMEEEFEVMEEMEERVRKLREKREALRHPDTAPIDTGQAIPEDGDDERTSSAVQDQTNQDESDDDDDDDDDDWYA